MSRDQRKITFVVLLNSDVQIATPDEELAMRKLAYISLTEKGTTSLEIYDVEGDELDVKDWLETNLCELHYVEND